MDNSGGTSIMNQLKQIKHNTLIHCYPHVHYQLFKNDLQASKTNIV